MMRKLPGMLGVRQVDSDTIKVVFNGGKRTKAAVIAWAQQHGATIQMNRSQLKRNGENQKGHAATKYQAKKLVSLGFKAPVMVQKGRKGKSTHERAVSRGESEMDMRTPEHGAGRVNHSQAGR